MPDVARGDILAPMQADRLKAHDILDKDELEQLGARSNLRGVLCVLHAWSMIAAAMALFAWRPNPLTFLVGVLVIGSRQLGLAVLMHDGAHGILTHNRKLNDFLGQWLCAYPVFSEMFAYRAYHLKHHARTQQPDDPDLDLSAPFPITKKSFRRKILRDLTGQSAFQQRRAQFVAAFGATGMPFSERIRHFFKELGGSLLTNAILAVGVSIAGFWWVYPLLWIVPLMTWFQVVLRVRNIAEHAVVPDNDDPFRNARTTLASWWERALFAPYWVNFHVEHHLVMRVPCYRLTAFHAAMAKKGLVARMEIRRGYREVIALATSRSDEDDRRGGVRTVNRAFEKTTQRVGLSAISEG